MDSAGLDQLQEYVPRGRTPAAPESERSPAQRLTGDLGNRGFSQLVARMRDGDGILPSGVVHPDVESAIASSRGAGQPLDSHVSRQLEPSMQSSLGDVRVHTGDNAAALARAVSARAFTVGNDIFFGSGEYRPGSSSGNELIAHEVAHTIQQRDAPASGPLMVSQPGDALEREAEAVARDVTG